jgi:sirohydrochlorin ferrochelatase
MTELSPRTAVVVFAHGSSVKAANQSVHDLAERVERQGPYRYVRAAFLEPVEPTLKQTVGQAVEAGFTRIVVVPYFLTLGLHLRRDLPSLVEAERKRFPQVEFQVGESLDDHPLMASIILGRIREATASAKVAR